MSRAPLVAFFALAFAGLALVEASGLEPTPSPVSLPLPPRTSAGPTWDLFPLVPGERTVRVYLCSGVLQGALETVCRPPEKVRGDDYAVLEVRAWTYMTVRRIVAREWLRSDAHGIVCARREEGSVVTDLDPPQRVLDLPLETGKRWTWKGSAAGIPCESTSVVVGREKLVVPYATFEGAWRVDTTTTGREGERLERSMWLAPGMGLIQEVSTVRTKSGTSNVSGRLEKILDDAAFQTVKPNRRG